MKRSLFSFFAAAALIFSFTGCQNFLTGGKLKNDLDDAISYSNASCVILKIEGSEYGTIYPSANIYTNQYKPQDPVSLNFTESSEYQFLYWHAEPSQYITFDDIKNPETTAKITKDAPSTEQIVIAPVCARRPQPEVSPDKTGGNKPKNTSIIIDFDYKIQNALVEGNDDINLIDIQIDGKSIKDNYLAPYYTDNNTKIEFDADDSNLIDLNAGTETVKVIIPAVFYYENESGTDVYMADEVTSTFTIDYTTSSWTIFETSNDDTKGTLKSSAISAINYYGEEITLNYTVKDGYEFFGWSITGSNITVTTDDDYVYADGKKILQIVPNGDDYNEEYEAANSRYKIIYKVIGSARLLVSPVSYERPVVSISPSNEQVNPKNEPVVITFSQPISEENDLSTISLTVDGISVLSNFNAPVLSDNKKQVTFTPKRENLIDTQSTTKTVTVKVPSEFYYTSDDGNKVSVGTDTEYSYTIDSTTVEKVDVSFSVSDAGKTTINYSGTKTFYLDNSFTVSFKNIDSAYQFDHWFVGYTDSNQKDVELEDGILTTAVSSEDNSLTVTVEAGSSTAIKIYPVFYIRPYVYAFTPSTSLLTSVPKDSTITIIFSQKMNITTSVAEQIKITSGGDDFSEYFKTPVVDHTYSDGSSFLTAITFEADKNNLIPLTSGTKNITVTIPGSLYYITDDVDVCLGDDVTESYRINTETTERATVSFNIDGSSLSGQLSISGDKTYNYGDEFTVTFTPYEGYSFVEWSVTDADSAISYTVDGTTLTGKVTGDSDNVVISAVTKEIETVSLNLYTDKGTLTPSGSYSGLAGTSTSIMFISSNDYQFTEWKLYNALTGEELENDGTYVTIGDADNFNTTLTLNKKADSNISLKLVPECSIRPQVLSATPYYSASGVYRDTRIMVTFSKEMSEGSIFFDENDEEISEIDNENLLKNKAGKIYGYVDSEGEYYFKNIKITNFLTKENMLENYDAPYFDTPQVLYIPTKQNVLENGVVIEDNAPAQGTQPYVELSKDFYYLDSDENQITMGTSKEWNYRVNNKIDNDPPSFTELALYSSSGFDETKTEINAVSSQPSDLLSYEAVYLRNRKLEMYAEYEDLGSGPSGYIRMHYEKVLDDAYDEVTDDTAESGFEDLTAVVSTTYATFGSLNNATKVTEAIDFSKRSDGLYKIWFECEDINGYRGNSYEQSNGGEDLYFYALLDNTSPYDICGLSGERISSSEEDLSWNYSQEQNVDFAHCEINCYESGSSEAEQTLSTADSAFNVSSLVNQVKYTYEVYAYDVFGNKTSAINYVDDTAPLIPSGFTGVRNAAENETISWSYDDKSVDLDHVVVECYVDGNDTPFSTFTSDSPDLLTNTFEELTDQVKYSYKIYSVDFAGNKSSDYMYYRDDTKPNGFQTLTGVRSAAEKETINWTYTASQPADFAHLIIESHIDGSTEVADSHDITAGDTLSTAFTGLTDQTKYSYSAYILDYAGNKTSVASYVDNTAPYNISKFTGERSTAEAETINWTYTASQPADFAHLIIEKHIYGYSTILDTKDITASGTLSTSFSGLTNQTKYSYTAYALDYAGNKTSVVSYVDTTGPKNITSLSGLRSSAAAETINWSYAAAQPSDFAYIVLERYVNGSSTVADTQKITAKTTYKTSFSGLTDQTKYSYKAYAYDYAGNKSNVVSYVDNTAPNLMSTVSGQRKAAANETISWSFSNKSDDFAHVIIERVVAGTTSILSTDKTSSTSYTVTGLTNQVKYTYNLYAVDYSGNKSSYVTYTDNSAPEASKVYTTSRKGVHKLYVTHANDVDWAKTVIYQDSTCEKTYSSSTYKNTTTTETLSATTNTSYTYYVYTYDFAGNSSLKTVTEKCGPGSIYYSDGTSSSNYYSDKTPIGVVAYIGSGSVSYTNDSASRIWGLDEVSGYCWGSRDEYVDASSATNGYYNYSKMYNSNVVIGQKWGQKEENGNCYSFTQYLVDERNVDSTLTAGGLAIWYAPASEELTDYLYSNRDSVEAAFELLDDNGIDCTYGVDQWIWSSTKWNNAKAYQIHNYTGYSWDFYKNLHKVDHQTSAGATETYCHFMAMVNLD